jgi:hypothetical protein
MRADGVVDFFPLPQLAIECFHFQRARRDRTELLGVGAVGAFHRAVEFRGTRGQHEQVQSAHTMKNRRLTLQRATVYQS